MNFYKVPPAKRYIPAIILIAIFIVFTHILNIITIESNKENAKQIDISGKQRMLSQKLVIDAINYISYPKEESKKVLLKTIENIKYNHKYILTKLHTKELNDIFYKKQLNTDVKNYIMKFEDLIFTNDEEYLFEARLAANDTLIELDKVVKLYTIYSDERLNDISYYQLYLTLITLFILLMEVLYIFKPAAIQIEKAKEDIDNLNNELEFKIIAKTQDLKEQNLKLLESEKMASLGEMIGNIAHQWRQPLNGISISASTVIAESEMGVLEDSSLKNKMETIIVKTNYLSDTIDTFRDFIKGEKKYTNINIKNEIKQAINITSSTLETKNISFKSNINYKDKLFLKMVSGELPQVLINIINNAKDILVEKDISKPKIWLNLFEYKDKITITIEDNGGGIPNNIINKIFEPYFTTKHQSQGTGLGLNMSYQIIVSSLKGKLYVKNTKNGAKFFIELPLNY
ncbi:MAG: ATP-binding protein [Campylobacterota bacterium]|nr:ATP-binding protein [Campylobacterota bacterium]